MPDTVCSDAANADCSSPDKATAGVESSDPTGETSGMEAAKGEAADEKCRRPPVKIAFGHVNTKGQPIAFRLGLFQHHQRVLDFRAVLVENRQGGIGGSLAKLSSLSLLGDHSSSKSVVIEWPTARTGRLANTMEFGATPGSVELANLQGGSTCIHHNQATKQIWLVPADCLLQRHMLGHCRRRTSEQKDDKNHQAGSTLDGHHELLDLLLSLRYALSATSAEGVKSSR
ncbi:hypothetical protein AB7008_40945 [Bradyrhizobium sp. 521_C7_N1_3]|uniref:hypothetical protein n=1 Tax=Bradyrhizobium sp. 521_C7_N1_3 TaxID=3240368 RepID=UPI003F89CAD3